MTRKRMPAFLVSCLLGLFSAGAENLLAQETEGLLERILNPLPNYDPFDKPPPSPQFFPDDVNKRARAAMIDSLTYKQESLEGHLRFFMERDAKLKKERRTVTGLTEHVLDLYNNAIQDRERYLQAQKKALSLSLSPKHKQLVESRIQNDDLNRADDLLRQSGANRWGAMFNRLLGSVDMVNILTGSYVGAAVDSTILQLLAATSSDMPIEERKALALLYEHLKRYPGDSKNPAIQTQVEALEKTKKRALVQKQIERAKQATLKKDLAKAEFHYELAAMIDPLSREAQRELEQTKKRLQQRKEEQKKGLAVATNPAARLAKASEDPDLNRLLYALTLRDREQIEAQAKVLREKHWGKPLADSAKEASAVALEIQGQHEEAKKILAEIARSSANPHEKRRAEALLKSPEYNLLASLQEARSQRRLETVKYVLLGEDLLKKNLLYGTAPLIVSGPTGAATLAAANVIMIGTNLFQVLTTNPISYQPVIDRGVEYIRSHPESKSAGEVYSVLADAYEEAGIYDRAIAYHEMSGKANKKKMIELKEKAAKALLQAAEQSEERGTRQLYLKAILDHYPDAAAAKEAAQKLAALAKIETQGLSMSKKFLMENPELYGQEGLSLKPSLVDGNLSNMELADQGVNLLSERELLLHFKIPRGLQSEVYLIDKQTSERFHATLRRRNYEIAMGDVNKRAKGSPGGIEGLPPPLMRGELEKKEAGAEGAAMTLVREATALPTDSPRVLHHQLLSENEKESGRQWKLPSIQGSLSASRFDVSGSLPAGLWQNRLSIGADEKSPFAGLQLPIPLLQGFIPVDFLVQGRPGRFSLFPKIHLYKDKVHDKELYR